MSDELSVTAQLAAFALDIDLARLPRDVRHAVRRATLDSLGVAVAGSRHRASGIVVDSLPEASGPAISTLIGFDRRADAVGATLANGVMAHVLDWDDTLLPARLHLSATLVPALLAIGETTDASGGDFMAAFAVGFEIQARLANAISPVMPDRGWHGTGVVGGIGVAAAAGRMLRLSPLEAAHAMGIAGTAAAGLTATFGTMAKALNLGRAGASGLHSAQLAALGFTSHPDLLGTGGFLQMYDDAPRTEALTERLGSGWAILDNGYKPYPCGVVAHAAIDAVLELRAAAPPSDVPTSFRLTVSPETVRLMGNARPSTGLEAKFSVTYACVVAWLDGQVIPASFDDAAVADPVRQALLRLIGIEVSDAVAQDEAVGVITTASGWTGTARVAHARGTRARPLDDAELREKFRTACHIGESGRADELIDAVERLEDLGVRQVAALLAADTREGS